MVEKDKQQELLMRMHVLEQHIQKLAHESKTIEGQDSELESAQSALESLSEKGKTNSLVQVAGGIFAHASIHDFSKLLVNVGANVVVEKPLVDILDQLKLQREMLTKVRLEIEMQQSRLLDQAKKIQSEFENL